MYKFNLRKPSSQLYLGWILGLILGASLAAGSEPSFAWMRLAAQQRVSIVFFWILAVFPFLLTAYAATVSRREILLAVCFCHTFFISYLGVSLHKVFGSAGWLLEPMLLFSELICLPVLFWFSYRHLEDKNTLFRDHIICLILALIAASIQYFTVTPFLTKLIFISLGRYEYSCWI